MAASVGDCSVRSKDQDPNCFSFEASGVKSAFLADLFASVSFTAQHGNYQRLFLDLTRFHARLDFSSGSRFLSGATRLTQDLINSRQPSLEDFQAICPNATLSLQQQVPHFSHNLSCLCVYVCTTYFWARLILFYKRRNTAQQHLSHVCACENSC